MVFLPTLDNEHHLLTNPKYSSKWGKIIGGSYSKHRTIFEGFLWKFSSSTNFEVAWIKARAELNFFPSDHDQITIMNGT